MTKGRSLTDFTVFERDGEVSAKRMVDNGGARDTFVKGKSQPAYGKTAYYGPMDFEVGPDVACPPGTKPEECSGTDDD